jgi:predicted porin
MTSRGGYGRQCLNADVNHFASIGADYALSKRTTLYASLGNKRAATTDARTSFGMGLAHAF